MWSRCTLSFPTSPCNRLCYPKRRLRGAHSLATDPHPARSTAPSEIGVLPYNAYGNGLDGDSASTASDISGAPSGAGYPGAAAASSASVPYGTVAVPGTAGGPSARPSAGGAPDGSPAGQHSRQPTELHHHQQHAYQHTPQQQQQRPHEHGVGELVVAAAEQQGDGGGAGGRAGPGAGLSTATGTAAMRLGIRLEGRTDVRRLMDLLVEKLEVACGPGNEWGWGTYCGA